MKKIVIGILAHVDSGKTTLTEAMLYESGNIKKLGRVDNCNATLDTHSIERKRGITIFSKQAVLKMQDTEVTILDTPGHTDFSSEMERALSVLDYAVVVINGADGVQSHTQTLWDLLALHKIPTFIYVNKMDIISSDKQHVISQMRKNLSENIVDYLAEDSKEKMAECNEQLLEKFLNEQDFDDIDIAKAISKREIFLSFYGSALKLQGVKELLTVIDKYTVQKSSNDDFKGKVYKITRDNKNVRLTNIKVTSGVLKVKDILKETDEKIQQIRIYSGEGFEIKQEVEAGDVCSIVGLQKTYAGQGLGYNDEKPPVLKPIMSYAVKILDGSDPYVLYEKMKVLADEDPVLQLTWNENTKNINVGIMGDIQIEVLRTVIMDRFSFDVDFDSGKIVYRETIDEIVEGVGHFEPLRHYAEVRLLLEPLERGTGIVLKSKCRSEDLSHSYQSLVLSHLDEINHRGALTGSYITDMRITLVDGKAHPKHTEGGDFRQATYRALQQGLRKAQTKLLEPYYSFELTVPSEQLGKALHDLDILFATIGPPEIENEIAIIKGKAPVDTLRNYAKDLANQTKGKGKINCVFLGYFDCMNTKNVVSEISFDSGVYPECNADSVFCSHGSGFNVKWDVVEEYAHTEKYLGRANTNKQVQLDRETPMQIQSVFEQDKELMKIYERTYGAVKRDAFMAFDTPKISEELQTYRDMTKKEYLLVDGYNMVFAWENLAELAKESIDHARNELIRMLCNYQGYRGCEVVLVFDAYRVKGDYREVDKSNNIHIIYTKEAETADMYIEKTTHELARNMSIRVATSDALEQMIIMGHGALRVSANMLYEEVRSIEDRIREHLN